ncbi:MAG: hypothetical protein LBH25_02815 [Fibromonadaceae bacterium]|jgi:hypothetical protein|nr:hypothetical protein [Fibromonadaceae bacterium]
MINYFLNFVNQNPWLNIVFIALTLLGILLTLKSKKSKKPIYRIKSINLVKDSIDKIKCVNISHNGEKINNLSVSKIAIWNAGEKAVRNKDVPEKGKFRIEIDDGYKILECELLHQINDANDFKLIKISDNIFHIDFDYFNHNEGIVVLVYHTAITEKSLNVKGSFIDAKNIIRDDSAKKSCY